MSKLTHEELISRAKFNLYKKYPFFSYLVNNMPIYVDDALPTIAVSNRGEMRYSPKFIEEQGNSADMKGKEKVLALVCHEVLHLAYRHPARALGKNIVLMGSDGSMTTLWNIAIDIVVNNILIKFNFTPPECGIIPKDNRITIFGYDLKDISDKSAEDIYYELLKEIKDQKEQQSKSKGKGEGKGQIGQNEDGSYSVGELPESPDEHKFDEEGKEGQDGDEQGDGQSPKQGEKDWGKLLQQAANYAKQRGEDPADMGREFQVYKNSQINWKAFVRKEVGNKIPSDWTYMKPNKKGIAHGFTLPSLKKDQEINILFHIDTSGSMGHEELSATMTEIYFLARHTKATVRVITGDCPVCDDIKVDGGSEEKLKNVQIHGGGGTDHHPIYDYIQEKKYNSQYSLLISFTDGYSSFPRKPNIDTLFVLTKDHCPVSSMPKWSRVIEMK